jgi:capsular polysaccharide biosynthesis protein
MDAATALRALRRGWFFVVVGGAVAATAAFVLAGTAAPYYEASSTYVVSPPDAAETSDIAESIRTLDDPRSRAIVSTFVEVLSSDTIHTRGAALAGLSPGTLDTYSVRAVVLPEANVVELTVRGPAPEIAAALSGAIGISAAETFIELYKIYDVSMLDGAEVPESPAGRSLVTTVALAGLLGLAAGAAVALLWGLATDSSSNRLQTRLASYDRELTAVITPLHPDQEHRGATRAG